ncbi:hypothetical protein ACP70R_016171 [Stipagrostis hirtigluma subsp. patula]
MGRPRGKGKKPIEAATNDDDDGSSGGEEVAVAPAHKRRGRPHKPVKDDADDVEDKDSAEVVEEDGDGARPVVSGKDSTKSSAETESVGKKRRRRRRLTQSSDAAGEGEDDAVKSKPNGFRQNGSRRKSTPRRAAEAGVECK